MCVECVARVYTWGVVGLSKGRVWRPYRFHGFRWSNNNVGSYQGGIASRSCADSVERAEIRDTVGRYGNTYWDTSIPGRYFLPCVAAWCHRNCCQQIALIYTWLGAMRVARLRGPLRYPQTLVSGRRSSRAEPALLPDRPTASQLILWEHLMRLVSSMPCKAGVDSDARLGLSTEYVPLPTLLPGHARRV
jgi:hypothetical protein